MAVAVYMDVHVPQAITDQLRRRQVDVLTSIEDGTAELPDDALLEHVTKLSRVMFTQDIRFKAMAENWQQAGRELLGWRLAINCREQSASTLKTSN